MAVINNLWVHWVMTFEIHSQFILHMKLQLRSWVAMILECPEIPGACGGLFPKCVYPWLLDFVGLSSQQDVPTGLQVSQLEQRHLYLQKFPAD